MALTPEDMEYLKESYKMAAEAQKQTLETFDKNLLFITSGTLVLSLAFIEKVVPLQGSACIGFLIASWIILTLSLLLNLISHYEAITILFATLEDVHTSVEPKHFYIIQ
jgi:hypothetical protein